MAIRRIALPIFVFLSAVPLYGQQGESFSPSIPYRAQLAAQGPVREIGLREAIAETLRHNPEIEIDGYGAELWRANTANAMGYFDPVAVLNASQQSSNYPVNNILQTGGLNSQITHSLSVAPSLQQNLPGGGTATLSFSMTRTSVNSDYTIVNPSFNSNIGLTINQPLWRGFRHTDKERQIVVSRLNGRISEIQFRERVANSVEQAIGAYWRLAVAVDHYEAERQGREAAVAEYEQMRMRVKAGQETASALASQGSEVSQRESSLAQALLQATQAANGLKRLLASSVVDSLWSTGLIASDRPEAKEPSVGLEQGIRTALERRPELEQLRAQRLQNEAELRFARQETKPAVNLHLEMLSAGSAGIVYAVSDAGVVTNIPNTANSAYGGVGKSFGQAFNIQHPSITGGVEIRVPVGNRTANAQVTTAVIEGRRLQSQLRIVQEDILVEVSNAWGNIGAQRRNVEAADVVVRVAEDRLAAEVAKEASEERDLEVVRARRDLARARVRELQAVVDYRMADVSYQKAMNTLIDDQEIVLAHRK